MKPLARTAPDGVRDTPQKIELNLETKMPFLETSVRRTHPFFARLAFTRADRRTFPPSNQKMSGHSLGAFPRKKHLVSNPVSKNGVFVSKRANSKSARQSFARADKMTIQGKDCFGNGFRETRKRFSVESVRFQNSWYRGGKRTRKLDRLQVFFLIPLPLA